MESFSNKFRQSVWLAIFLFSLLGNGQNAKAQWGLVDTVWCGPLGGEGNMYPSDNDSLFTSGTAVWKTIDNSIIYLLDDKNHENIPKLINDSTLIIHKYIQHLSQFDSLIVVSLRTSQKVKSYNSTFLEFDYLQAGNIINSSQYSKYDNCVYGFGNKDETGQSNTTRKLNLETGEITEVPFLNGLAGGSISSDGELVAGYYFQSYWKNGKTLYDQYFKVYSLKTGETIISSQVLTTGRENIDIFPEFIFSRDHHYLNVYSFGSSHIWDLSSKTKIKQIQRISLGSGKSINFTKVIFTNDSKRIFTLMSSMRNPTDEIMLDSTGYIIYDLSTLKEYRHIYPYGISFGGTPQAFVFGDNYFLTDGAVSFDGDYIRLHQNNLGNSSLLHLNFDINSIQEPEQNYDGVLYPNPATEYIIVGANRRSPLREDGVLQEIRIFDIFGKCALNVGVQNFELLQKIDISTLPAGIYFVRVGNDKPMKFVVMR